MCPGEQGGAVAALKSSRSSVALHGSAPQPQRCAHTAVCSSLGEPTFSLQLQQRAWQARGRTTRETLSNTQRPIAESSWHFRLFLRAQCLAHASLGLVLTKLWQGPCLRKPWSR